MDQALKQRLVGALVITALAAIFVPMFFEDSVDESRREIKQSDLAIPAAPEKIFSEDNPIPQSPQQLHTAEEETAFENSATPDEEADEATAEEESAQPEQPLAQAEEAAEEEEEQPPVAAPAPEAATEREAAQLPPPVPPQPLRKIQPAQTAALQALQEKPPVAQQPKQAPTAVAPAAKTPELKRWVLQLGSFSKKANADSLVNKLRSQGFNAYGDTIQVAGKGTMYRVRIGPELDKKRAQATQKKLQQLNAASSMLISE